MSEPGDKLARRYRELGREEPPAALDASILAASRRAVASRPALARRWAAPVSIAAVLVLAFGVTLQMQRDEPGVESSEPARPAPSSAPVAAPAPPEERRAAPAAAVNDAVQAIPEKPSPKARKAAPQPSPRESDVAREIAPRMETFSATPATVERSPEANVAPMAKERRPEAFAPPASITSDTAASPAPARAAARMKSELAADSAAAAPSAQSAPAGAAAPERELERIARLREAGRHADADKALEEFRRDHPQLRIPDAMWERVRPR